MMTTTIIIGMNTDTSERAALTESDAYCTGAVSGGGRGGAAASFVCSLVVAHLNERID